MNAIIFDHAHAGDDLTTCAQCEQWGDAVLVYGTQIGLDFGWAHYEVVKP